MQLVPFDASDGVRLHGLLYPSASETSIACDAALFLHGAGSNFYGSSLLAGILPALIASGVNLLSINTRGHDLVCTLRTPEGGRRGGAAFEIVDECRLDIRGAVDWLVEQGHRRIALVGHSLGALKAIYSQALDPHEAVSHIVAISPPLLSHAVFCAGPRRRDFLQMMSRAQQLVAAGEAEHLLNVTIPLPLLISAGGYVDKYGPAERYNLRNFAGKLTVPTHFVFGEQEVNSATEAFGGMDRTVAQLNPQNKIPFDVSVVPDADHFYSGCTDDLAETLIRFGAWRR